MSFGLTFATAGRVRADRRTLALLLVVPCVLMGLLAWIYAGTDVFDHLGAPLLGVFPFVVMFLVTSVATLRERTSGTLEDLTDLVVAAVADDGPDVVEIAGSHHHHDLVDQR